MPLQYFMVQNGNIINSLQEEDTALWCDLIDPDENEMSLVANEFDISFDLIQRFYKDNEHAYYEFDPEKKNKLIIIHILKSLIPEKGKFPTIPFCIILTSQNKIITIHSTKFFASESFFTEIKKMSAESSFTLVLNIIECLVDCLKKAVSQLSNEVQENQFRVTTSRDTSKIQEGINFGLYIAFFNSAMVWDVQCITIFIRRHAGLIQQSLLLSDKMKIIQNDMEQIYEVSEIYRGTLQESVSAFASTLGNNLLPIFRMSGAIYILMTILVGMASFLTLNVINPWDIGLGFPWTFLILIFGSFTISSLLYQILHKKKAL